MTVLGSLLWLLLVALVVEVAEAEVAGKLRRMLLPAIIGVLISRIINCTQVTDETFAILAEFVKVLRLTINYVHCDISVPASAAFARAGRCVLFDGCRHSNWSAAGARAGRCALVDGCRGSISSAAGARAGR